MGRTYESSIPYPVWNIYRIVLAYAILAVCRIVFTLYNIGSFGEFGMDEVWDLVIGGLRFDTISIAYAYSLWALAAFLPLPIGIRNSRWYRTTTYICYMAVTVVCIALNFADAIYFRYVQKRFTAEEIFFADNSNSLQLIGKFAIENLHLVVIGIVLIWLAAWAYRRRQEPKALLASPYYYIGSTLLLVVVVALAIGGIRGGWTRMARPTAIPYSLKFARTGTKANIVLSNPFCIIRTAGDRKTNVPEYFDDATLSQIYEPYHYPEPKAEGANAMERPNVVIMVLESMSAEHSALLRSDIYTREGEPAAGYTPFLDSLMRRGYRFDRMYANGKRSIQALPSVWASIPSLEKPFVLMSESLGESRPLPKILKEEGYATTFFCGSERGSMGFDAYALSAGFERCISKEDYEDRHGTDDFDGYWGIWDHRFLDFMGEEIGKMQEPFLASIFTTTSHHPFVTPEAWKEHLPKGKTPMQPCAAYLDEALRQWFEKYSAAEWFDNTIFIFVADHVSSERYDSLTQLSPGDLHIIGFMYRGDGSLQGRYSAPASQIDLMPTLLGFIGYDKPYFAYGRDLSSGITPAFAEVVVCDNELYKAFDDKHSYIFNEGRIEEVRDADGSAIATQQPDSAALRATEQRIKAYVQQYYRHAEQKRYMVK